MSNGQTEADDPATALLSWRARAEDAEAMVRAIQAGQVDALVRLGPEGHQVFTLEGAEHVYHAMVDSMGEGALTLDPDGLILYANRRLADLLGTDLTQLLGVKLERFVAPDSIPTLQSMLRQPKSPEAKDVVRLLRPDGARLHVCITFSQVAGDEQSRLVAVVTDLTEVTRVSMARDHLARIVDGTIEPIISVDLNRIITSWNQGAELLFGYSTEEAVGSPVAMLAPPDRLHEDDQPFASLFGENATPPFETMRMAKHGQLVDVVVTLSPVLDEDGGIMGASYIFHDISERKRLERIQDGFISTVSHELRTPLTSIAAALALISKSMSHAVDPRADKFIDIAYRSSERLVRLVNDILDVERLQSGRMTFVTKPLEIQQTVRQAIDGVRSFAVAQGVKIKTDFERARLRAAIDPDRFNQAITNLLSNAIKFSARGETVTVRVGGVGDCVRVSVIDHGPGIPEEFRSRLFERFAQADSSASRAIAGTGLGLSIARDIIQRMDGRITFESTVGAGTTFHVDVPKVDARDRPAATPFSAAGDSAA